MAGYSAGLAESIRDEPRAVSNNVASAISFITAGARMFVSRYAFRAVLMGLVWTAMPIVLFAQFEASDPNAACSGDHQKAVASVDRFVFRTYQNDQVGDSCLQVFDHGKLIFKRTLGNAGAYTLGQPADESEKTPSIPGGTDITGRGYPDMIVSFYTGGAHCCLFFQVFELEPEFRLLATLDAEDGDLAHFERIQGKYYFRAADWTFAYWRSSFAGSPAPEVILGFMDDAKGGGYHLALDKMKRPEPTSEEWAKKLQDARNAFAGSNPFPDGIDSELWGSMLDFIYQGHSDLAWKIFDQSWPSGKKGKDKFLSDFCSQLKLSPYWSDVEKNMRDAPQSCVNAQPAQTGI
jgi:hypothetical protein